MGTSTDAVSTTLQRIERFDGEIGAFVTVQRERALADARRCDATSDTAAGAAPDGLGVLHGVPVGIKELFDVEGADASRGSVVLEGRTATSDAPLVTALRGAGAVVIGTTRTHEFAWGITTQHVSRGSTRNPWNLERVPGGSSGGSAAAVAAGLVPLAVGTDTGGSIRLPAAFCGVLGLKTTFGRIPRTGSMALAPSFDSPGFLARSVALLAAALEATWHPDQSDPATIGAPDLSTIDLQRMRFVRSKDGPLKFAVPPALSPFPLSPLRQAGTDVLAAAMERTGAERVHVDLPDVRTMFADIYMPIQLAEALDVHRDQLGLYPARSELYGPDVRSRLDLATYVTLPQYLAARRRLDDVRAQFLAALQTADVLISPVGATGPSLAETPDVVAFNGGQLSTREAMMPYTVPQNLAGLPSITVPVAGLGVQGDEDGMPIGIQITGAPWSEGLLLSIAALLERDGVIAVRTPPRFAAGPR